MANTIKGINYHPVLLALIQLRKITITSLAIQTQLSRPYIMKILSDPDCATGYDRAAICAALKITTRFLDGIITGKISKDTKFPDLYNLQEANKKQTVNN